jgi:hypothetical protein
MLGHELAIEQAESADPQPRHQPGEGDLGGVRADRKHALAEKGAGETHAIEPADQHVFLPAFDRMGVAGFVQPVVAALDRGVDPGLGPLRATADDGGEGGIAGDGEDVGAQRLAERAGEVEAIEREDRALAGLDPENLARFPAVSHREDADGISAQQQIGIENGHGDGLSPACIAVNRLQSRYADFPAVTRRE